MSNFCSLPDPLYNVILDFLRLEETLQLKFVNKYFNTFVPPPCRKILTNIIQYVEMGDIVYY